MLYLLLAVCCSVILGFIFKLYARFGIDTFQAIVFNYITCVICGWIHLGYFPIRLENTTLPWWPFAMMLGVVFITGFNAAAFTVRYFSVTLSQIMQRMSILATVPFAIFMYHESSGWGKISGFLCAIAAIILVNWTAEKKEAEMGSGWLHQLRLLLPLLTWVLAGILEITFVYVQGEKYVTPGDRPFICTVFGTAGTIGLLISAYGWISGRMRFSGRNVLGGIILGIPNYGSMLFLLLALSSGLEGSFVFPVTNVGIIIVTTIFAVWLFHERLSRINWIGVACAVMAILLISFG